MLEGVGRPEALATGSIHIESAFSHRLRLGEVVSKLEMPRTKPGKRNRRVV